MNELVKEPFELTSNSPDDPRMHKKWGHVTALPSEYLIHFHNGKIRGNSSGQGATCFKCGNVALNGQEILFSLSQLA